MRVHNKNHAFFSVQQLLVMFCLVPSCLFGQQATHPRTSIIRSVGLGLSHNQIQETSLVPITHTGMGLSIQYHRKKQSKQLRGSFFSFGAASASSRFESSKRSIVLSAGYGYHFLFKIQETRRWQSFAGPMAGLNYSVAYFPNWDDSHLYWANRIGIGVKGSTTYSLPKMKTLGLSLELPLAILLSRPSENRPYKFDDLTLGGIIRNFHSRGKFMHPGNMLDFRIGGNYTFTKGKKRCQAVGYTIGATRTAGKTSGELKLVNHSLSYQIQF